MHVPSLLSTKNCDLQNMSSNVGSQRRYCCQRIQLSALTLPLASVPNEEATPAARNKIQGVRDRDDYSVSP